MGDKAKQALQLLGIAAAIGGPYSAVDFKMPRPKQQRGTVVGCSRCGKTRTTLYREADGTMICKTCKEGEQNE